jgi:hypothetical protein
MPDGSDPEQGNFYSFRNETGVIVAWPRRRQLPQRSLVSASEIGPSDLKRSMILAAGRLIVRPPAGAHDPRVSARLFPLTKRGEFGEVLRRHLVLWADHDGVTSS